MASIKFFNDWEGKGESTIRFKRPFSEKYTLVIESDLKGVNVVMKSKTQMRWDFRVLNIHSDEIEIELLLLENILLESNNPVLKDLSAMSQVFGKMYSELHLTINPQGEILKVLNLPLILEKWNRTKQEMQAIVDQHPEIKDVILLNDSVFQNPEKIKKAIKGSEFFMVYFHFIFGTPMPTRNKRIELPNVLNTAFVDWQFSWSPNPELANANAQIVVVLNASPIGLSEKWYQEAYKSFAELINVRQLRTSLSENGLFRYDITNGKLLECELIKEELADKDLFCKVTYILTANSYKTVENEQVVSDTVKKEQPRRRSFLDI